MDEMLENSPTKKKRLWLIPLCCVLLALVAAFILTKDLRQYETAQALFSQGSYQEAAKAFAALGDYRDASQQAQEARYLWAQTLQEEENYAQALEIYEELGSFDNSEELLLECSYRLGLASLEANALDDAIGWFAKATDEYKDAKDLRLQAVYRRGHELFFDRKTEEAQPYFDQLKENAPQYYIPHFLDPREAIDYLKSITEPVESVSVAVGNMSPFYENMDYWNSAVQQSLGYQFATITYDPNAGTVTLEPDYYPGQRILWAWQTGDFSALTEEEKQTCEAALALVEQAKSETEDLMELELWLHDWICSHVEYDSPYAYVYPEDYVGLQELTCVGAILDGKANCQGYTDAFYLLCNLAGIETHKVFGSAGEGHCWNAVRLDGWLYTVDVTFNDTYCEQPNDRTYIWYNNALDMNQYTVWGGVSQFEKMVFLEDLSKTYYAQNDLIFPDLNSAVGKLLRLYKAGGKGLYYAVVDGTGLDDDDFYDAVADNIASAGVYAIQWVEMMETYKEDTYITVRFERP